jgi:predicted metal-dependent HD superfamily phosphohydrolase
LRQLTDPLAAQWALWFHDAIYIPWRPLNEEKSAAWATRFMQQMQLPASLREQVARHILDTRHQAVPAPGDAQWIVDIDLAILGQNEAVYRQFEKDVRSEYRWVRWSSYVKGRSAVLQSFLERPRIYSTPWFHDRLEASARANLTAAVRALADGHLFKKRELRA